MPYADPEQRAAYHKRYREEHREQNRVACREWYVSNGPRARETAQRRKARNRAIIAEAKAVPCRNCGERFHKAAMDFHHVNGNKEASVGTMLNASVARLRTEIEKCVVLCSNCHRTLHAEERAAP